ncbi:MAG: SurA N-terminal domain-containing protein [Bacteroidales bacterium]|nr:SurA N-terminal domain-containing protein [Bacteroidales bacterium]
MAVLEKIRVKFGIGASIIIALGLLSFIISPDDLERAFQSMSSKYDVGKVGGKSISYDDFKADVDNLTEVAKLSGMGTLTSQQQEQIRDAAWQDILVRNLFLKNAEKSGLNLGEDEKVALTTGSMISPMISRNGLFFDEDGNFSAEKVVEVGQASKTNPQLRRYWDNLLNSIYNQQVINKYSTLFANASVETPFAVRKDIEENNVTSDVEFIMLPYGYTQDSTVVVTDAEVKEFYNNHKKFYKQIASRDIEYVVFETVPSQKDIESVKDYVGNVYNGFAAAENVKSYLSRSRSEIAYDEEHWYTENELKGINSDLATFVENNGEGAVSDVIQAGSKFFFAKVMGVKVEKDQAPVKQVAIFQMTAQPGNETANAVYQQATNFAAAAHDGLAAYRRAVDTLGVYSHPYPNLTEGSDNLGAINNTKVVTNWAFENKVGKVSDIKTVDNKYHIIAVVTGVHEEGIASLQEVASDIRQQLYIIKLGQKKTQEVAEQIAGLSTMEEIAEKLNASVSTRSGVTFSSRSNQSLDNAFIGAISAAEPGKIAAPVAGAFGTYIFKVTARDTGAFYTEDDAKTAASQYALYSTQGLLPVMMEEAEVKDNRARFF